MRGFQNGKRGLVMVLALVATTVVATMAGAFCLYYVNMSGILDGYASRFGVQQRKFDVYHKPNVGEKIKDIVGDAESIGDVAENVEKKFTVDDGDGTLKSEKENGVQYAVQKIDLNKLKNASPDVGELDIEVRIEDGHGGLSVFRVTLEFKVVIEGDKAFEVFNYVYFANNYGHLESKNVIANGNVGSNDRFTIDSAVVNGYVKVRADDTNDVDAVKLRFTEGRPRIWPYGTYMDKVRKEYTLSNGTYDYTPVRPTNPIHVSSTSNVTWRGGYEPPGTSSQYGSYSSDGTIVIGDAPQPPAELTVTNPVPPTLKHLSYPEKEAKPAYPDPPTKEAYPDKPTKEAYPDKPTKEAYPDKPTKDAYPDEPERHWWWGYYYTYKGKSYSSKEEAYAQWNKDKAAIDAKYDAAVKQWEAEKAAIDKKYEDDVKQWEAEKAAIDAKYDADVKQWEAEKAAIDAKYDAAVKEWEAKKAKIDSDYETYLVNWQKACDAIDVLNEQYKKEYDDACAQYLIDKAAYDAAKKQYDDDYAQWKIDFKAWQEWKDAVSAGLELTLSRDLVYECADGTVKPIISVTTNVVEMPNVSDDDYYRAYCQTNVVTQTNEYGKIVKGQVGGSLKCDNRYTKAVVTTNRRDVVSTNYTPDVKITWSHSYAERKQKVGRWTGDDYGSDYTPFERELSDVNVTKGYQQDIMPFKTSSAFSAVQDVERGSVILIGTAEHPIEIHGPVYFDGDVVIRGFVKGQGSIYAGRNVHVIGDITYLNPPHWPHANLNLTQNQPQAMAENNRWRDFLMLVARGNVVVGDYTNPEWGKSFTNWVNAASTDEDVDSSFGYCNKIDDSDIGYPSTLDNFKRNYLRKESGGACVEKVDFRINTSRYKYENIDLFFRYDYFKADVVKSPCCHYESRLGGAAISELIQPHSTTELRRTWILDSGSTTVVNSGTGVDYSQVSSGTASSGDVTEIDAVLFANHGIFGTIGGECSDKFTLNGGMVCRDEGLLSAFKKRNPDAKVWLNWDMRWSTGSAEANLVSGSSAVQDVNSSGYNKVPHIYWRVKAWH